MNGRVTRLGEVKAEIAAEQVRRFVELHGLPPTYLQLASLLHCGERTARRRVEAAEARGLLIRSRGPWPVGGR
jgi:predicted glycoside hydrolase/deacetylase ChbG (UPF0249 family)